MIGDGNGNYLVIWPERRVVTALKIRGWYDDAVANGDAQAGLTEIEAMAHELSDIGHVTFGRFE